MKKNQVLIFRAFTKSQLRALIILDLKVCTFDISLNTTRKLSNRNGITDKKYYIYNVR